VSFDTVAPRLHTISTPPPHHLGISGLWSIHYGTSANHFFRVLDVFLGVRLIAKQRIYIDMRPYRGTEDALARQDHQDTFNDLGKLVISYEFSGLDLSHRPPPPRSSLWLR
jgi:hypothetical protein